MRLLSYNLRTAWKRRVLYVRRVSGVFRFVCATEITHHTCACSVCVGLCKRGFLLVSYTVCVCVVYLLPACAVFFFNPI